MGMFYQYFSIEPQRWNALFNGSIPNAKKHFAASATWGHVEVDLPDPETQKSEYLNTLWNLASPNIVALAEHVSQHGISYRGLSEESASLLDSMIAGFFCQEGLESVLKYTVEHSNGLSQYAIEELLSRSLTKKVGGILGLGSRVSFGQPVKLAQWLKTGRRFGTSEPPNPEDKYFFLESDEIEVMLSEVRALLAVDRNWKTKNFESAVRKELLAALEKTSAEKKYLFARYT